MSSQPDQQVRTFHEQASSHYSLPNDATEHHRLELQSQGLNEMLITVFHPPLSQPRRIMDVGCGTGHIVRLMCAAFPSAEVIGLDLSDVPPQPEPCRAMFIKDDIMTCTDSRLQPDSFDYIFSRLLVYGMGDWPAYLARTKSLLKSGAWIELQEVDPSQALDKFEKPLPERSPWRAEQKAAFAEKGIDMASAPKVEGYVREAGFVNVHVQRLRWVTGPYEGHPETQLSAKVLTQYNAKANAVAFRKMLGGKMSEELLQQREKDMLLDAAWDHEGTGKHLAFFVIWAQKP